jgi:hypothetical protein
VTLTAIQALALWNNPFMLRMAEHLAERSGSGEMTLAGKVRREVRLVLERDPRADEQRMYEGYASRHGLANLARVLFNTNEFLFVD